jgi:sugar/nucleoside kinase (ribokinase family)
MGVDVLILNTAVVDFRGPEYDFTEALAGPGGLAKGQPEAMPPYAQADYRRWIEAGTATAGGPGNCAPLLARAGLKVAVGVNLGAGEFGGLDAQGRFFYDTMAAEGIDMSATVTHPTLPTGTTFIHEKNGGERDGIVYFPNANHDFDFAQFRPAVERLEPKVVYYMYSGLSDRGDANGGRDLAAFIAWCRERGCVTIVDSHTLTGDPQRIIEAGERVEEYHLLEPLLPELDIFFASFDEARMIVDTMGDPRKWGAFSEDQGMRHALNFLTRKGWRSEGRTRLFGITFGHGAYMEYAGAGGQAGGPARVESRFMCGEVIDLVGAGDSFRAGLIADVVSHLEDFKKGSMQFEPAIQMGNLFASLYIKAPLSDRYGLIRPYAQMAQLVADGKRHEKFEELVQALG